MPEQEKRCGTCEHLSVDRRCCVDVPFWIRDNEELSGGWHLGLDQGTDCDAWTPKPEKPENKEE